MVSCVPLNSLVPKELIKLEIEMKVDKDCENVFHSCVKDVLSLVLYYK